MNAPEPSVAIHRALIAALDDAVECPVWDAVPPDAPYPYVTLDSIDTANNDLLGGRRMDTRFAYLNVWSTKPGQAEVLRIMGQIDALHETKLAIQGLGYVVSVRVDRRRTMRDTDNLTFQGQVTLRLIVRYGEM
jgi:hypothetical protein